MTKVFIAGSRRLHHLNDQIKRRIDTITEKGFSVLVGDANGADKAVQLYLADKDFRNVIVHCMAGDCRNNLAGWLTHEVEPPPGARGFAYFSAKDLVMANEASYGFMLWDGKSKGTLNNMINLIRQDKPVVVYLAPQKRFRNLRSAEDLSDLLRQCDEATISKLEHELGIRQPTLLG